MRKPGRNDMCPCGSGKKFKRCCLHKTAATPAAGPTQQLALKNEIKLIQDAALAGRETVRELGVFILLSTAGGDAWLLEVTQSDALLVAKNKEIIEVELEENPETIEINWSHTFVIENKQFITTAYKDKAVSVHESYPTHPISAATRRIKKKYSPELLDNVHLRQAAE